MGNPSFDGKMREIQEGVIRARGEPAPVGPQIAPRRTPLHAWAARIEHFALFSGISRVDRSEIVSAARERLYSRGQMIYIAGDNARHVVLLASGSAKMVLCGENGSAVILRLCGPGDLVGALGTMLPGRYRSTPQALSESSALIWEIGVFHSLAKRFPSIRFNVASIVCKQLEEMEDRFREVSTERVAPRLGRQIFRLVEQVGIHSNGSVEINLNREELAQLIGTSLFTVSRLLSEWDRQGIVVTRREGFSVVDLKALEGIIE
jgi:CRP-like cAMP-binding protein